MSQPLASSQGVPVGPASESSVDVFEPFRESSGQKPSLMASSGSFDFQFSSLVADQGILSGQSMFFRDAASRIAAGASASINRQLIGVPSSNERSAGSRQEAGHSIGIQRSGDMRLRCALSL